MPPSKKPTLEQVLEQIHTVSSLPHITMQVMEVVSNPDTSAADLKGVVEGDPSLTARVLRTINSAAYALRSQVTDIQRAISLLGFNEVKNIAITASVADIFKKDEKVGQYDRRSLWKHMVCVGLAARVVASRAGLANFDEAFLAGLMHDLGIVLMDQFVHDYFVELMTAGNFGEPLYKSELKLLGFDHTQLGEHLSKKWRFPTSTQAAMRYHHFSHYCNSDDKIIVQSVEIANFLVTAKKISSTGAYKIAYPEMETFSDLQLDREGLKVLLEDLEEELQKSDALMNI